jgi:nitrate reductase NapD
VSISSIVVMTLPENLETVLAELKASQLCEVFLSDQSGKIIVTIEADEVSGGMQKMGEIQNLPHVLSVQLAYSYYEEHEKGSEKTSRLTD